mmetsp:Transcript_2990/g.8075  ORF Transcript_2990/g.8075 Transcript_2990/m.8075 type:complete len:204 (+) Transcript_2990:3-614(+)
MGRKRQAHGEAGSDSTVYEGQGDPLLVALFEGDADAAAQLIETNAADVEAADQLGWRPLHRASFAGFDGIVSLLLGRRADPATADADGLRPLHVAASRGHAECCRLLVAARADPAEADRYSGMTAQMYALGKDEGTSRELEAVLGAPDLKLLAAWGRPLELAKQIASASTEEERVVLERKWLEDLGEPDQAPVEADVPGGDVD